MVETRVIISKGISTGFKLGQTSISPAEAGMNISGIMSIRNIEPLST